MLDQSAKKPKPLHPEVQIVALDQTQKRQRIAENAIIQSTILVNALLALEALQAERLQAGVFADTDFDGSNNPLGFEQKHLTAGIVGQLMDFVVPSLAANYQDDANGNRNRNILLQMRR